VNGPTAGSLFGNKSFKTLEVIICRPKRADFVQVVGGNNALLFDQFFKRR